MVVINGPVKAAEQPPCRRCPPSCRLSILRLQAHICQFCGAKERCGDHALSLFHRQNSAVRWRLRCDAARAAATRSAHPPFSSPSFTSPRRRLYHAQFIRKRTATHLMSKRPASSASGRKEFFGLAAQLDSSALNSASEGLANPQEALRRSGRNSTATPTAATAPASPAMPARNSSEPSQVVRSRSASRVRAPAVLPTEGSTRALKASAPAPITGADAENLEPPLPTKAKEKKKARARSDPVSPLGVEDRVRIPVHLAADCEWTDAQVLAADELRRAAANPAHFFSTGSASTGVPSTIGAVQHPAVLEEAAKTLEPSGKKAKKSKSSKKITADSQPADVVSTTAATAPLPVIGAPSSVAVPPFSLNGSVAPKRSRSKKSSSRFPVTFRLSHNQDLLNHDQEKPKKTCLLANQNQRCSSSK